MSMPAIAFEVGGLVLFLFILFFLMSQARAIDKKDLGELIVNAIDKLSIEFGKKITDSFDKFREDLKEDLKEYHKKSDDGEE